MPAETHEHDEQDGALRRLDKTDAHAIFALITAMAPQVELGVGKPATGLEIGVTFPVETAEGAVERWHPAAHYVWAAIHKPPGVLVPVDMVDDFHRLVAVWFVRRLLEPGTNAGIRDSTAVLTQQIQECLSAFHKAGASMLQSQATLQSVMFPGRTPATKAHMAVRMDPAKVDVTSFRAVHAASRGILAHLLMLDVTLAFDVVPLVDLPEWARACGVAIAASQGWRPLPYCVEFALYPELLYRERVATDRLVGRLRHGLAQGGLTQCAIIPEGFGRSVFVLVSVNHLPRQLDELRPDVWDSRGPGGRGPLSPAFVGPCPPRQPFSTGVCPPPAVLRRLHRRLLAWLSKTHAAPLSTDPVAGVSAVLLAIRALPKNSGPLLTAALQAWGRAYRPDCAQEEAGARAWMQAVLAALPDQKAEDPDSVQGAGVPPAALAAWRAARFVRDTWCWVHPNQTAPPGGAAHPYFTERYREFCRWLQACHSAAPPTRHFEHLRHVVQAMELRCAGPMGTTDVPWHWLPVQATERVWQNWTVAHPDAGGLPPLAPAPQKWPLLWACAQSRSMVAAAPPNMVMLHWLMRTVSGLCLGSSVSGIPGIRSAQTVRYSPTEWGVKTEGSDLAAVLQLAGGGGCPIDPRTTVSSCVPQVEAVLGLGATVERFIRGNAVAQSIKVNPEPVQGLVSALSHTGRFLGIGRKGIAEQQPGPISLMTTENPCTHALNAAFFSVPDSLTTTSADVMTGKPPPCGSGGVRVVLRQAQTA